MALACPTHGVVPTIKPVKKAGQIVAHFCVCGLKAVEQEPAPEPEADYDDEAADVDGEEE